MGLYGPQESIFPLRTAWLHYQLYPGDESARCDELYRELIEEKGNLFARDIGKSQGIINLFSS